MTYKNHRANSPFRDIPFAENVDRRRANRMDRIDRLPADVRECVKDYGFTVVVALQDHGVTTARGMRHIVETILNEFSPTRGSGSRQGIAPDRGVSE